MLREWIVAMLDCASLGETSRMRMRVAFALSVDSKARFCFNKNTSLPK